MFDAHMHFEPFGRGCRVTTLLTFVRGAYSQRVAKCVNYKHGYFILCNSIPSFPLSLEYFLRRFTLFMNNFSSSFSCFALFCTHIHVSSTISFSTILCVQEVVTPIYIMSYCIKWVTTSWTYGIYYMPMKRSNLEGSKSTYSD